MANKNKQEAFAPYGAMAIPKGESRYSILRWGWGGLNSTDTIDSGNITDCSGVSINPPYVDSYADLMYTLYLTDQTVIGVYGFDDYFIVIYQSAAKKLYVMQVWNNGPSDFGSVTRELGNSETNKHYDSNEPRSVVRFNAAVETENIVNATYVKRILIYPDCFSFDLGYDENFGRNVIGEAANLNTEGSPQPPIKYAAVYASRLFGVDNNKIYASEFNNYAGWNLDTTDDISEAHAWISMTQSNTKADGFFTGIYTYDNHIVLFKKDFTQLVYSDSNPFRIVDLTAYGAENPNAYTEAEGVLYFASHDNVYAFTGGIPKSLGENLSIPDYTGVCLGSYKNKLYMSIGKVLYCYNSGVWSKRELEHGIIQFASTDKGLYGLVDTRDKIVMVDSKKYEEHQNGLSYGDWWFETDLMCGGKMNIRRVKKLSLLCDIGENASVSVYLLNEGEEFNENTSVRVLYGNKSGKRMLCGLIRGFCGYAHKLRICGTGKVRVHAAELLVSWGGDLYRSE